MKTISIVTPCYNEEDNIKDCYAAVRQLFDEDLSAYRREHIFCDNASTDGTVEILRGLAADDADVRVILNARDFGPLNNTYNGIMAASGDAVLLFLPADMQDPPELLPKFVQSWEEGYDIVYGIRAIREEGRIMRATRDLFYRLLIRFSEFHIPPNVGDFQLVDRRVVTAMAQIHDSRPFTRLMTFECGGRAIGIPYTWRTRKKGVSKNRMLALFDQGMTGVVSFTTAPIRFALFSGFIIALLAMAYALFNLVIGLFMFRQVAPPGIVTLIVALFFFSGVQLFFMGVIGEYILAIYIQARGRPVVLERERINFAPSTDETAAVVGARPDAASGEASHKPIDAQAGAGQRKQ